MYLGLSYRNLQKKAEILQDYMRSFSYNIKSIQGSQQTRSVMLKAADMQIDPEKYIKRALWEHHVRNRQIVAFSYQDVTIYSFWDANESKLHFTKHVALPYVIPFWRHNLARLIDNFKLISDRNELWSKFVSRQSPL